MKKLIIIRLSIILKFITLTATTVYAQVDPMFSQYDNNKIIVNPGYAGINGDVNFTLLSRYQWVGLEGSPRTYTLSVHGPLRNRNVALGGSLVSDKIGVTSRNSAIAYYAYQIKGDNNRIFSMGVQGGITLVTEKYSSLELSNDPTFSNDQSYIIPNFGFGIYYSSNKFFGGISIPRLMENGFRENSGFTNTYVAQAGLNLGINRNINFIPYVMAKITGEGTIQMDFSSQFEFGQHLMVGAGYRHGESILLKAGIIVSASFRLAYSYDSGLIGIAQNGSHELMLNYRIPSRTSIKGNPRHIYSQMW